MLRIRGILIRIRGSLPLTKGFRSCSGSCYIRQWPSRQQLKMTKFAYYFLKLHFHYFSKIKSQRSNYTMGIKVFLTIFAWWWKDSDQDPYLVLTDPYLVLPIRIREVQKHTYGSGSGSGILSERGEGDNFFGIKKSGKLRFGFWSFLFWPCLSTLVRLNVN